MSGNYIVIEKTSGQLCNDLKEQGNLDLNTASRQEYEKIANYITLFKNIDKENIPSDEKSYLTYKNWEKGTLYSFPNDKQLYLAISSWDKGINEVTPTDDWRNNNTRIFNSSEYFLNMLKDKEDKNNKKGDIPIDDSNDSNLYPNLSIIRSIIETLGRKSELTEADLEFLRRKGLTISDNSFAYGSSIAGIRGYYCYKTIPDLDGSRVLIPSMVQNTDNDINFDYHDIVDTSNLKVGDKISIGNNHKIYKDCSTIIAVYKDHIEVDSVPFESFSNINLDEGLDESERFIFVLEKPEIGYNTIGTGAASMGNGNKAINFGAFSAGLGNISAGVGAFTEGCMTYADFLAHAEGLKTIAGPYAHAQNMYVEATGIGSSGEGYRVKVSGTYGHGEGQETEATASCAHSQNFKTKATAPAAHAQNNQTEASGENSDATGFKTKSKAKNSHTGGEENITEATAVNGFTEGYKNTNRAPRAFIAGGQWSSTSVDAHDSLVHGIAASATAPAQRVGGKYPKSDPKYLEIVGNGKSSSARSNAYTLDENGNAEFAGEVYVGSQKDKLITVNKVQELLDNFTPSGEENTIIVQADYEEDNESNKGYIRNRPFYQSMLLMGKVDGIQNTIINAPWSVGDKLQVKFTTDSGLTFKDTITLQSNKQEYFVCVNCVKITLVNSFELKVENVSTTQGFLYVGSIEIKKFSNVKQIEEKFIPDTIARKTYVDSEIKAVKNEVAAAKDYADENLQIAKDYSDSQLTELISPNKAQNLSFKKVESSEDVVYFPLRDDYDYTENDISKYKPFTEKFTGYIYITINNKTEKIKVEFSDYDDQFNFVSQGSDFIAFPDIFFSVDEILLIGVSMICNSDITGTASLSYENPKVLKEGNIPNTIARQKDLDLVIQEVNEIKTNSSPLEGIRLISPSGVNYILRVDDDGVLKTEFALPEGTITNIGGETIYEPGSYEVVAFRKLGTHGTPITSILDTNPAFEEHIATGSPAIGSMTITSLPYAFEMPNAAASERFIANGYYMDGIEEYETELFIKKVRD